MDLINIALVSASPMIFGGTVDIQVVVESATAPQRIVSTDLVFEWDSTILRFVGVDNTGGMDALLSFIPEANSNWDFYGLNEANPPADGNALYYWLSPLDGVAYYVPTEPTLLTTLKFEVLSPDATTVNILSKFTVDATARTVIYGSNTPGLNVTGTMTGTDVSCRVGDFNCDGVVGSDDLTGLLSNWNAEGYDILPWDLNQDGKIDSADMSILLSNWG